MSQGYNPRPRISLPSPLAVGLTGLNEVLDFELDEWMRPAEVRQRLARQLPEGIVVNSVQSLPVKPDRRVNELSYRVALLGEHPVTQQSLRRLVDADEALVDRNRDGTRKTVNVARFLRDARLNRGYLLLLLEVTQQGTARPEEVLQALGLDAGIHYRKGAIERTHVSLSSSL